MSLVSAGVVFLVEALVTGAILIDYW
jgi:hypothetical protein